MDKKQDSKVKVTDLRGQKVCRNFVKLKNNIPPRYLFNSFHGGFLFEIYI